MQSTDNEQMLRTSGPALAVLWLVANDKQTHKCNCMATTHFIIIVMCTWPGADVCVFRNFIVLLLSGWYLIYNYGTSIPGMLANFVVG